MGCLGTFISQGCKTSQGITDRAACMTEIDSHRSRGWKSKTKVSAGLVPSEASFLALQMTVSSPYLHTVFCVCVLISSSLRTPVRLDLGPPI